MTSMKEVESGKDMDVSQVDNKATIAWTILTLVAVIIKYIFTGINSIPNNPLFNNTIGNVSDKYPLEITPASYTFIIWSIIYLWEATWMVYVVVSIWRKFSGDPVLMNPDILPKEFFIFYILTCVFYVAWLFLWDREHLLLAFIDLLLLTGCGYAAVAYQGIATANYGHVLKERSSVDLTLVYVLVQNGTDLFFSWTTVATLINLAAALVYDPLVKQQMSNENASTLSLSILAVLVIGWSVAENTIFYDFFHFVYAWYGVLIWACIGVLVNNYTAGDRNSIFTIVLLCIIAICLVIKIVVFAVRNQKNRA